MAHSASSQDLLKLLLRGGAGGSAANQPASHDQSEDQLVPPISPSKPGPSATHTREQTPSGQETLETLFSALRGNAPPDSNISPSAVSHAERQSSSSAQFQAATASPTTATSRTAGLPMTATSPYNVDHVEGRNLLLSMLNVRSPPAREASIALPSRDAALLGDIQSAVNEELGKPNKVEDVPLDNSEHSTHIGISSSPQVNSTPLEELTSNLAGNEEMSNDSSKPTQPSNEGPSSDTLLDALQQPSETYVQEGSSNSFENDAPSATEHSEQARKDESAKTSQEELESVTPPSKSSTPVENDIGRAASPQKPLHELTVEIGSVSESGEDYVVDRVPISRFTSSKQDTTGRQIAVNGLIAYGTRAGRVRVIDPDTGARLIKKLHSGLVTDMDMSGEFFLAIDGENARRLVTCFNNELKVWQIPSSFVGDDATNHLIYQASLDGQSTIASVHFSPVNHNQIAFTITSSPSLYLLDLKTETLADSPVSLSKIDLIRLTVLEFEAPVASMSWSPSGSILAALSSDEHLGFYDIGSRQTFHTRLGRREQDLGPVTQVELLQRQHDAYPSALLVTSHRGTVIDIYDLLDLGAPTSRLHLHMRGSSNSSARTSIVPGYNALLVSVPSETSIHSVSFKFPDGSSASNATPDFVGWTNVIASCRGDHHSNPQAGQLPTFIGTTAIPTTNYVLQMISATLNDLPGVFYLHTDGFEQISLRPALFETPEDTHPLLPSPRMTEVAQKHQIDSLPPSIQHAFLQAFDESVERLEQAEVPVRETTADVEQHATLAPAPAPITAGQVNDSAVLETFQKHLVEQNILFSQMLAAQQQLQEARYLQLAKDIASLRREQVDPFEQVSRAIRSELRENLLPVIASALAEIGNTTSTGRSASAPSVVAQQEQLIQSCSDTMTHLFGSFSRQLGPAITEALSGTLERHLARLTIGQAEQADASKQIREILLTEQMKREELSTSTAAEMQTIKFQLVQLVQQQRELVDATHTRRTEEATNGHQSVSSSGVKSSGEALSAPSIQTVPKLERSSASPQRPSTPNEAYEDMFLRALTQDSDPLRTLIDEAPPSRMDRVLPYDGRPRITAPAFLALCMQLARDFDNSLPTLDERNDRVRLAWILASLRAAKWAKGEPQNAAFLPRVFTHVMHSLNARKQTLVDARDIQEIQNALQLADELSGLW